MEQRPAIMAVLDTSGSMIDPEILASVRAELTSLLALADVTVVECDTEVQRVRKLRCGQVDVVDDIAGCGGTSFLEPLEPEFLRQLRPDVVL